MKSAAAPRDESPALAERLQRRLAAHRDYTRWRNTRLACVHGLAALGACFWLALLEPEWAPAPMLAALRAAWPPLVLAMLISIGLEARAYQRLRRAGDHA